MLKNYLKSYKKKLRKELKKEIIRIKNYRYMLHLLLEVKIFVRYYIELQLNNIKFVAFIRNYYFKRENHVTLKKSLINNR